MTTWLTGETERAWPIDVRPPLISGPRGWMPSSPCPSAPASGGGGAGKGALVQFSFLYLVALLKYNAHIIQLTHLKCTIRCLLIYLWNSAATATSISEYFYQPQTPPPALVNH